MLGDGRPHPGLHAGHATSDDFKTMQPNAIYVAARPTTAVFDPRSKIAGVASPVYDAAGNDIVPAINGDMEPAGGHASRSRTTLQNQME